MQRLRLQGLLDRLRQDDPKDWCSVDGRVNSTWLDRVYAMPCNDEQWSWMPRERCIGNQAKWAEHARGDMRWSKQVAKKFDRREVWDGEKSLGRGLLQPG